jgi:N6-adenosine-specific RNA methylase IME4
MLHVLFLWATVPMLQQALQVMSAWGFKYKSHFVWIKDRIGTGYWNRNKHELLLVGTRGKIPAPAPGTQCESAIEAAVGRHSAKPECFLELIERYFPTLPKIELNRRGPSRPGWSASTRTSTNGGRVPDLTRHGWASSPRVASPRSSHHSRSGASRCCFS